MARKKNDEKVVENQADEATDNTVTSEATQAPEPDVGEAAPKGSAKPMSKAPVLTNGRAVQSVKDVLAGKKPRTVLRGDFIFDYTPQGHDYWYKIAFEDVELDDLAKAYLHNFLDEKVKYDAENNVQSST